MHASRTPSGARRPGGIVIGRAAGAPVVLRGGWLIATVVLAVVAAPWARQALPDLSAGQSYLVGVAFALLLLGSVLVHELAHAYTARLRGVGVREIALTLVGGHTEMAQATRPGTGALVAVAGPVANIALAVTAWWAWQAVPGGGVLSLLLLLVASSNALVAGFNLLPGLPMDGGWILEAAVWRLTGRRSTGTTIAAWIGRGVAVVVVVYAVGIPLATGTSPSLTLVIWAAIIGAMLWTSAGAFLRSVATERALEAFSVAARMRPVRTVSLGTPLSELPDGDVVVVGPQGEPVGHVDVGAAGQVPTGARPTTPVEAVLVPIPPAARVPAGAAGRPALEEVARAARTSPVMAVVGADGDVVGLLTYADVVSALRAGS